MIKASENSKPWILKNTGKGWNRIWFFVGLVPFFPALIMSICFKDLPLLFSPVLGFVPVDFFHHRYSPTPEQIRFWYCTSLVLFFLFAALAFFKKPFGILFASATWSSSAMLLAKVFASFQDS